MHNRFKEVNITNIKTTGITIFIMTKSEVLAEMSGSVHLPTKRNNIKDRIAETDKKIAELKQYKNVCARELLETYNEQ